MVQRCRELAQRAGYAAAELADHCWEVRGGFVARRELEAPVFSALHTAWASTPLSPAGACEHPNGSPNPDALLQHVTTISASKAQHSFSPLRRPLRAALEDDIVLSRPGRAHVLVDGRCALHALRQLVSSLVPGLDWGLRPLARGLQLRLAACRHGSQPQSWLARTCSRRVTELLGHRHSRRCCHAPFCPG